MPALLKNHYILAALCLMAFAWTLFAHWNIGLADNGDFTRDMVLYTAKPVGFAENKPSMATNFPAWSSRFFNYFVPDWEFQWHATRPRSAVHLLWLPGAALNWVCRSREQLSLRWLSLPARLALLAVYATALFFMARTAGRQFRPALFFLLIPLGFMLGTREYLAYLNSFFCEPGSLIFLLFFLSGLIWCRRSSGPTPWLFSLVALAALIMAKASNIYWAALGSLFLVFLIRPPCRPGLVIWIRCGLSAVVALLLLALNFAVLPSTEDPAMNAHHSLYNGVLRFSAHPATHLQRLGLADTLDCVGDGNSWEYPGSKVMEKYHQRMTHKNTLEVLAHEPLIAARLALHALRNMQDLSIDYLGRFPGHYPDPCEVVPGIQARRQASETRCWLRQGDGLWNLWAQTKYWFFPRGSWLALTLAMFGGWFLFLRFKTDGLTADLAHVGLLTTLAVGADMIIAVLGDGCNELIKHLFMANVLFDLSAILCLGSAAMYFWPATAGETSKDTACTS